jgi:chromosome segregation protein
MKIKRLDILGFKSFHDKVSLDFPEGITGIVGPNGCGKSNVVDAIRWVMGEQSAKNLRGRQMEDIIFGGSELRTPVGIAEVSLTFSTEDGLVPVKYLNFSEIQVTRRLFRNGDSEYLLNKSQCRLLDITELFMDTGVGAKAYSIIEQGKIGMILHSKPEERRVLIEEAAGVTKFKARKQVALKKIEITRQNLLRISDIIAEIKRQLNGLQRQAKKAEKFREYREELKEIELLFAVNKYITLKDSKKQVDDELVENNKQVTALIFSLEECESAVEVKRITLLEVEKTLGTAQEEIFRVRGEIQGEENRLEFQKKELTNLDRHVFRFDSELSSHKLQLAEAEAELKSLQDNKDILGSELANEEQNLTFREKLLDEMNLVEKDLAGRLEAMRRDLFGILSEIANYDNKYLIASKRLEAMSERFDRNQREGLLLGEKQAEVSRQVVELQRLCNVYVEQKNRSTEDMAVLRQREAGLKATLESGEKELQGKRDHLSAKSSRLVSLQELEAQFAGYGQGVRSLLTTDGFKGRYRGMIADILEAGEEYEAALESVLGERLQWLLCREEVDALEAIAHLKEVSGGRCSFVLQMFHPACAKVAVPGAVSLLTKTTIADGCREFIEPLLANAYLADNLNQAFVLGKQYPQLTFVTIEGEMVHSGGIVNGGSLEVAQQGLIHKKREIKELSLEVEILTSQVRALEETRNRLNEEIVDVEEGLRDASQRLHNADIQVLNNEKDLLRAREESQRLEERAAIRCMEDDQLKEEKLGLEKEIAECGDRRHAGEERKKLIESAVAELQASLAAQRIEIDGAREVVTATKVRVAGLKEKQESNLRALKRVEELKAGLQARSSGHGAELEKARIDRELLLTSIVQNEESQKLLLQRQVVAEMAFAEIKDRYESGSGILKAGEDKLKGLRSLVADVRETFTTKTLKSSELSLQLQHLENLLLDKYRFDIVGLLPKYGSVEYEESIKVARQAELQKLIDEMGDVNLTAIDEFQELEKRFMFLSDQRSDLEESLQSLQKAIQRINKTTRKRFMETFQLVNAKFQEVFPRLFCGGKAELKLTNEDDLLETGLDIIVQPPGKKLQNVTLLSGGEKALTAVALIFSIFLIKPSPFCLLDEVDAPLDDANIGRFNEMVREMSSFAQFILITHNKTTMAVVDTLYGVTMEEPGVSKLVSVKLN